MALVDGLGRRPLDLLRRLRDRRLKLVRVRRKTTGRRNWSVSAVPPTHTADDGRRRAPYQRQHLAGLVNEQLGEVLVKVDEVDQVDLEPVLARVHILAQLVAAWRCAVNSGATGALVA